MRGFNLCYAGTWVQFVLCIYMDPVCVIYRSMGPVKSALCRCMGPDCVTIGACASLCYVGAWVQFVFCRYMGQVCVM